MKKKGIAVLMVLFMIAGCAEKSEEDVFRFSTQGMTIVEDVEIAGKIKTSANIASMSFGYNWSIYDEEIKMPAFAFMDAAQTAYYIQHGDYIWDENMDVELDRYFEYTQKFFAFSSTQVRTLLVKNNETYNKDKNTVKAADGYGNLCEWKLKEIWTDGTEYMIIYDYGVFDSEPPEVYEGKAYGHINENGDFIFVANRYSGADIQ